MAYAKTRESSPLEHFFDVPLKYTLLAHLYYLRQEVEFDKHRLAEVDHWISAAPRPFIAGLTELRDIITVLYATF